MVPSQEVLLEESDVVQQSNTTNEHQDIDCDNEETIDVFYLHNEKEVKAIQEVNTHLILEKPQCDDHENIDEEDSEHVYHVLESPTEQLEII